MDKRLHRLFIPAIFLAVIIALGFRLPGLDVKPAHTDEAVQGVKFGILLEEGNYRYNPEAYHGPTLYYLTLPAAWLRSQSTLAEVDLTTLRLVTVFFGVGIILLLTGLRDGLGSRQAVIAALLTAVSPAMVYFSRYYIQEMLLVFFSLAFLTCSWRYLRSGKAFWAGLSGLFAGLMHATKETFVITIFSMTVSVIVVHVWNLQVAKKQGPLEEDRTTDPVFCSVRIPHVAMALGVGALVSILFHSSFLTNASGPLDSIISYKHYLSLSGESGHEKPWFYYLKILAFSRIGKKIIWSEGLILGLALIGIITAFWNRTLSHEQRTLARFISLHTLLMLTIASFISYKTPWLVLGFLIGMILLAGIGAIALLRIMPARILQIALIAALAAGMINLGVQTHRQSNRFHSDPRNPYAYSPTSSDMIRLADRFEKLADIHPQKRDMIIKVIGEEYWPLPWYLRTFPNVGYWNSVPENPDADVIVATPTMQPVLETRLKEAYFTDFAGLRPDLLVLVHTRMDLWEQFLEAQR